jgi:hypothetical protein
VWNIYKFTINRVGEVRPRRFNAAYPWWTLTHDGHNGTPVGGAVTVIVVFLPATERLADYWPDALNIDREPCHGPYFTDGLQKPPWYVP